MHSPVLVATACRSGRVATWWCGTGGGVFTRTEAAQVSEVEGRTWCRLRIEMRLKAFIAMATHTIAESWSSVRWLRALA